MFPDIDGLPLKKRLFFNALLQGGVSGQDRRIDLAVFEQQIEKVSFSYREREDDRQSPPAFFHEAFTIFGK